MDDLTAQDAWQVAERAVAEFDFGPPNLDLISHHTNTVLHLTTKHGFCVVRVHRAKSRDQVAGEVAWLDALARDADIRVPSVQRTRSGEAIVSVPTPDGERTYPVTILDRVLGQQVQTKDKDTRHFEELGRLTAKLHRHARAWRPARKREIDRPEYNANSVLDRNVTGPVATRLGPSVDVVNEALSLLRERLKVTEAQLGMAPDSFGLIHCDLSFGNVLFSEQGAIPVDFDDCGFGYYLHDFAVPLAGAYQESGFEERYDAFLGGYRQVLALAPDLLVHLPIFLGLRSAQLILDYAGPSHWPEGILHQLETRLQPALNDSIWPSKWKR